MKKLLLFLFILPLSLFSQQKFADKALDKTSNAIEKVYSDGTKVLDKTFETSKVIAPKVEKALESLGTTLKVGANQVWNILVKQQLVWSYCFLILTLGSLINWVVFSKRYLSKYFLKEDQCLRGKNKKIKRNPNPKYESYYKNREDDIRGKEYLEDEIIEEEILIPLKFNQNNWFRFIHLGICIILSIFSFYHFSDMLTGFINPEFGAMKTIAEIASQIK